MDAVGCACKFRLPHIIKIAEAYSAIADEEFIRDKVPMTKEEIRILTMCKAKIRPDNIIWPLCKVSSFTSFSVSAITFQASCCT